jgi:hypothetical protein
VTESTEPSESRPPQLTIDPNFVERLVFESVRPDAARARAYHREFAACYRSDDPDERERAFRKLHEAWFDRLGFREWLLKLLREFPRLWGQVARVLLAGMSERKRQGVELFGAPDSLRVTVGAPPGLLLDRPAFEYWARHELQHIEDMLDPTFGYDARLRPEAATSAAENLIRERYALLWAISIDARLASRGLLPQAIRPRRGEEFARALGRCGAADPRAEFEQLWGQWSAARPDHAGLLERARRGLIPGSNGRGLAGQTLRPGPGAPCPLCRFPTHDWVRPETWTARLVAAVQEHFPTWNPEHGCCGQCAEIYRARQSARV